MRPRALGFTLVELLVVITLIVILVSMLAPALEKAIHQATLAKCAAQFRVNGMAQTEYAHSNQTFYASDPIPMGIGLNVWGIGLDTLPRLWPYGMEWQTWFCPLAVAGKTWSHSGQDGAFDVTDEAMASRDNATIAAAMQFNGWPFTLTQQMWWVPRQAGNGWSPHSGTAARGNRDEWNTDEWPTQSVKQGDGRHPLMSDLLYVHPGEGPASAINLIRGTHRAGKTVTSASALYPDLSVHLRTRDQFKLVQDAHYGNWY